MWLLNKFFWLLGEDRINEGRRGLRVERKVDGFQETRRKEGRARGKEGGVKEGGRLGRQWQQWRGRERPGGKDRV